MSSQNGNGAYDPFDWLRCDVANTVTEGSDGSISIAFELHVAEVVIAKPPPVDALTIMCPQQFALRTLTDVQLPDDFTLCLTVEAGRRTKCRIDADVATIRCTEQNSSKRRRHHSLRLRSSGDVEIAGGDWHIEAAPESESTMLNLRVDNGDQQLRISSKMPVLQLDSTGSHEYDLAKPPSPAIVIYRLRGGTAEFRRSLRAIELHGQGNLRILGCLVRSYVDINGDVEVHGEIENTFIDIAGDITVHGPARFGDYELRCNRASFGAGFASAGAITCEKLEITGTTEISGHTLLD